MNLQGDLADAQVSCGLLVEETAYHQWQDLALTRRETVVALLQQVALGFLRATLPVLRQGGAYQLNKLLFAEWLSQKIEGPAPDRTDA